MGALTGRTRRVTVSLSEISRAVSHALRHEPWVYELELDDEGWVDLEALVVALRGQGPGWLGVDRAALKAMIETSPKQRHELAGERIRALYGHSVPGRLSRAVGMPPAQLFHGTSPQAWELIRVTGLEPMGRQFVHLSTDLETAVQVGRRKAPEPQLLVIDSGAAYGAGVQFRVGNEVVWLAEAVPAEFVEPLSWRRRRGV